ncbi:hypothetical protein JOC55_001861 [Paenibacillus sacheonensis]|nr:hypothetical protein [Paenibacillus sacheonensis]
MKDRIGTALSTEAGIAYTLSYQEGTYSAE